MDTALKSHLLYAAIAGELVFLMVLAVAYNVSPIFNKPYLVRFLIPGMLFFPLTAVSFLPCLRRY